MRDRMKDRILVSGYYGFGNAGDEAILASIVKHLKPAGEIVVLSAQPRLTEREHQVRAIGRLDLGAINRELAQAALFISGGGGLLQDATGPGSVPYYAGLLGLAQWRRVPTMILGAGIGPIATPLARAITGLVARRCAMCAVRDERSAGLLRSLGVPEERLATTSDTVLALDPAPADRIDQILGAAGIDLHEKPAIAVAIRPWPTWFERQFKAFSSVLAQVAHREGAQLLLLPFQRPHDDRITFELHDCLLFRPGTHAPKVTVLAEPLTPAEMMGILGRCDFVVGMRLHAIIMAAASAVPFVGVAYDPKVEQFAASWDMPVVSGVEGLEDSHGVEALMSKMWANRELSRRIMGDILPRQLDLARRNFDLARQAAGLTGDLQWEVEGI
jgi:polysaccharide pyruvyl transferase CsaB